MQSLKEYEEEKVRSVERDPKDFECFICFNIMVEPRLYECCNHHTCEQCYLKVKSENYIDTKCPMCTQLLRVSVNTIDTALQSDIKKAMPKEFAEMEA